jgi:hypothetical protein
MTISTDRYKPLFFFGKLFITYLVSFVLYYLFDAFYAYIYTPIIISVTFRGLILSLFIYPLYGYHFNDKKKFIIFIALAILIYGPPLRHLFSEIILTSIPTTYSLFALYFGRLMAIKISVFFDALLYDFIRVLFLTALYFHLYPQSTLPQE